MPEKSIIATITHRFIRGDGSEIVIKDEREEHEAKEFMVRPAVVRRGFGVTLNQGNFESTRVDIGVEMPCDPMDVELADEWARAFCEKRMKQEALDLKGDAEDSSPI